MECGNLGTSISFISLSILALIECCAYYLDVRAESWRQCCHIACGKLEMTALGTAGSSSSNPPASCCGETLWTMPAGEEVRKNSLSWRPASSFAPLHLCDCKALRGRGSFPQAGATMTAISFVLLSLAINLSTVSVGHKEQWAFCLNQACSIGSGCSLHCWNLSRKEMLLSNFLLLKVVSRVPFHGQSK